MNNLTKKIVVFFTAIFLSISLGSVSFADGHGKKILFSIKGPGSGNPFWASVTKGAEEEAKKLGVKLIYVNLHKRTIRVEGRVEELRT